MPATTRQGPQDEPRWMKLTSSVDLRIEILNRIGAYFTHPANVAITPENLYEEWMNGLVAKMSATNVCKYALDELNLRSIKWVEGSQLTKRTMLLSPFTSDMEAPETRISMEDVHDNTVSKSGSEDFTAIEAGSETEGEGKISNSPETTLNTMPSVIEGNAIMEGEMVILPNNSNELKKIILDVVDTHLQEFRKKLMSDVEKKTQEMIHEAFNEKHRIKTMIQMTRDEMLTNVASSIKNMESTTVEHIRSLTNQDKDSTMQQIQNKGQNVIKNIAKKRDEVLEDINEEAHQAIEDFKGATEIKKEKSSFQKDDNMEKFTQDNVSPSKRFPNVNHETLNVNPYEVGRSNHELRVNPYEVGRSNHGNRPARQAQSTWSLYGFHKHFKAKLKNDTMILNFYQQLYTQGTPYGVKCLPLQDIRPNMDLCPSQYDKQQRDEMALTIYQKLQDEDCVSVGYARAQRLILQYSSTSDGYKVLEQLLRSVHPNLKHSTSNTYEVPKLSNSYGNLYDYGAKIMNYILMQEIQHRSYSPVEQTIMFLNNMDEKKYYEAKNRALAEIRQIRTGNNVLDPNLELESLPTTLEQYHEQIHGTTPIQSQRYVRTMYEANSDNSMCEDVTEETPVIRSFVRRRDFNKGGQYTPRHKDNRMSNSNHTGNSSNSSNKQCKACGRWGCSERKCQFVAKVQLAVNFIKEHSTTAAKLAEEYLRTNDRRTRMSTIRTLTANMSDGGSTHHTDEELLDQYDIEIPMEEVDFSHQNE